MPAGACFLGLDEQKRLKTPEKSNIFAQKTLGFCRFV